MMHRLASQMCVILLVLLCAVRFNTITCCHESDRSLLLLFKQGVVDPSNRLSSWSTLQDCCQWEGILCDGNNRVTDLVLNNRNQNVSESLRGEINLSSLLELEFLHTLYFDYNDFERIRKPSVNNSVANHTHLLPNSSSSSMLTDLSLSDNIHLHIDHLHYWLSRLPSLQYLSLSGIHLPSDETNWVQSLASLPLRTLYLNDCNLTPSSLEHANFSSSLSSLYLGLNDLRYGFPNWLFNLSEDLSHLALSQCNLRGPIPDFSGYRNLEFLDLSHNKLEGLIPDWLGQLDGLIVLDLSNNSFHSSIPSNLINASSSSLYLDISFNNLSGPLPKILGQNMSGYMFSGNISVLVPLPRLSIFMSFNKFKGELPQVSHAVQILDLAHNSFSGPLSSLLCHTKTNENVLKYLDLSNNYLTQELPDCWENWALLSYINLGNNQLVGQVSSMMGSSLYNMRELDLSNNGFSGDIPWTFHDHTSLVLLNLEGNNFSGSIHTWIPQNVSIVKLRSNQFTGNIPPQLCGLSNLIVLDLANNKLSGSIPQCLHNITSFLSVFDTSDLTLFYFAYPLYDIPNIHKFMKIGLHTKGQQLEYEKNRKLVRSIDLSANRLSGEIPVQLFKLTKLQSLNLSYNCLIGEISEHIGEMKDLESLDLSHNHLHGNIPQSMSSLSFLSDLNMSYNHFSGQIPLGTQLQSFDSWSYTGNPELCGPPLQNNCTIPKKADNTDNGKGNEDYDFLKSLYLGTGVGFAVGFWLVCGSLFLNRTWRHAYFQFFNGVVDRIYVIVNIKLQRFR